MTYMNRMAALIIFTTLCVACGQKSALYLPEQKASATTEDSEINKTFDDETHGSELH